MDRYCFNDYAYYNHDDCRCYDPDGKKHGKSDAYQAAARYISSGEINRRYGSLQKEGWFSYGRISTEKTLADTVGTAVFQYEAEDKNGKRFLVQIRLTMENQTWVVTDCDITEIA